MGSCSPKCCCCFFIIVVVAIVVVVVPVVFSKMFISWPRCHEPPPRVEREYRMRVPVTVVCLSEFTQRMTSQAPRRDAMRSCARFQASGLGFRVGNKCSLIIRRERAHTSCALRAKRQMIFTMPLPAAEPKRVRTANQATNTNIPCHSAVPIEMGRARQHIGAKQRSRDATRALAYVGN